MAKAPRPCRAARRGSAERARGAARAMNARALRPSWRRLWTAVGAIGLLYVLVLAGLFLGQRSLLYRPSGVLASPAAVGLPEMAVIEVITADRQRLRAWFAPPRRAGAPTVVFFHGNTCNLSCW